MSNSFRERGQFSSQRLKPAKLQPKLILHSLYICLQRLIHNGVLRLEIPSLPGGSGRRKLGIPGVSGMLPLCITLTLSLTFLLCLGKSEQFSSDIIYIK